MVDPATTGTAGGGRHAGHHQAPGRRNAADRGFTGFRAWNTAYKYAVDRLPVMTVLSVMLLTAAAALWAVAAVKGRQRLTRDS